MSAPQIIKTEDGGELIVLNRRDYDALLARAGDPEAEDAMTRRIVAETDAAIANGHDTVLSEKDWQYLEAPGVGRLTGLRNIRRMTQVQLAQATGIPQSQISAMEKVKKSGSAAGVAGLFLDELASGARPRQIRHQASRHDRRPAA